MPRPSQPLIESCYTMIHRFRFYRPSPAGAALPRGGRAAARALKKDPSLFEVYSCALFAFRGRVGAAVRPSAEGGLALEVPASRPLHALWAELTQLAARWGGLVVAQPSLPGGERRLALGAASP